MKKSIIYSAGLTTRSVLEIYQNNNDQSFENIVGLVDDNALLLGATVYGKKVLGGMNDIPNLIKEYSVENFIIGIGSYKYHLKKQKLFEKIMENGLSPINCISARAYLSLDCNVGEGNMIFPFAMIGAGVRLNNNIIVTVSTSILEESIIENNVHIGSNTFIGAKCHIEENVYIGPGVTIASGVRVCKNSVIGAGSVVMKNVPKNVIGYGNPFAIKEKNKNNI
jgi:sugar O-acyltransferase (sialic acid O-acetyltransferase NeuD family)